ncbi:Uncharacterized protein related to plant photosystem II stability/assembly factor [Mycobacteroides abscessus subsp. abscessus]|uniref:CHAP domain-containing protein n=1 Tax=Mycobacteroides abscessus TaxID=36809 RepID=UPI000929C606|nr:CHAP domain-containing protein [Mycobacteroides abscessus]SHV14492.1 Uncharacterized protein related to plant photosystem II stability/assembly factor [Mycobacteroides abscessus subsp. abscessus]SKD11158.1 Uncharacterized protein related to plant photosystem II stability/assembly factor [Mycobacteroides abscessus subsp. abscessus]SKL36761.1 Uncharacterized protein related to plant photosystem II stability/assembly factor [Mycobacteroides abscessus subsp. abscessus]SKM28024.1 Uncharacterized 
MTKLNTSKRRPNKVSTKLTSYLMTVVVAAASFPALVHADSVLCNPSDSSSFSPCLDNGYTAHSYENHYLDDVYGSGIGYWRAINGHNCTNYAAYMMTEAGATAPTGLLGNAGQWKDSLISEGIITSGDVDDTPAIGAIAWWAGSPGHVAYVEDFGSDWITVSEDNASPYNSFRWRTITTSGSWPTKFLHIADLAVPNPGVSSVSSRSTIEFDGRMYAFATGEDGHLYYRSKPAGGAWDTSWIDRGEPSNSINLTGVPNAVISDGKMYVFAIGEDGQTYYRGKAEGSAWDTSWTDRGEPNNTINLTGSPNAIESDGRMYAFAIGEDGHLYYRSKPDGGAWDTSWTDRGEPLNVLNLTNSPNAIELDGKMYAFAIGEDGHMYYKTKPAGGAWDTSWIDRGEPLNSINLTGSPNAVVSHSKMYTFAIGEDGHLYYKGKPAGGAWDTSWIDRGEPLNSIDLTSSPNAIISDEEMYIFAIGEDGQMYYRGKPAGGAWDTSWTDRGEPNNTIDLTGSPNTVVSDSKMYAFAIGEDGHLYYKGKVEAGAWDASWVDRGEPLNSINLLSY